MSCAFLFWVGRPSACGSCGQFVFKLSTWPTKGGRKKLGNKIQGAKMWVKWTMWTMPFTLLTYNLSTANLYTIYIFLVSVLKHYPHCPQSFASLMFKGFTRGSNSFHNLTHKLSTWPTNSRFFLFFAIFPTPSKVAYFLSKCQAQQSFLSFVDNAKIDDFSHNMQ